MGKTEHAKQYDMEYIKQYQRQFMLKVNRKTESDLLEWLESRDSFQTYVKNLIRKDMEANTKR